ncbi:FAD-dependent oxidoreductase [Gordonia sp. CPCC 205515]|uniref:NAD(P)/FAD-dependent oxidoreductase n=1 Tax=Gordonia sp. CPCC 205515 TaxID=3140791 RepID=UPI003AF38D55
MNTTHIVVLGGGYAGTMAANRLSAVAATVTLVNPRPQFVHRIRLHQWVAGTGRAEHDFAEVLADGVRLVVDTATRIDTATGCVELASGERLPYDHLVYAVGSTAAVGDGIPGAREHGFLLGEWEAAQRLRAHLTTIPADAGIVVVGGGLTGMETAAELADTGRPIRLVCGGSIAPSFGDRAREAARNRLTRLGVDVTEDHRVTAVGPDSVTVMGTDGALRVLPSAATIITAGFGVPDLAARSGLTTDPLGRLLTDDTLTSVDDPRIVGAGDAVAPSNRPFRMSCQAANQLGPQAADTVRAHVAGSEPTPVSVAFVGQCTSLGRRGATVQLTHRDDAPGRIVVTGRTAAAIKELVCRSVIWGLRMEARRPGITPRVGGQERALVPEPTAAQ